MPSLKYRDPVTGELKRLPMVSITGGDEGNDKTYVHTQITASDTWNIQHNLNKYPSVTIINTANEQAFGDIIYIDTNNVQIKFSAAMSGRATLN